jgi:hypothetical protein
VPGSSSCCARFGRLDILERRTFLYYAGKNAGPSHVRKLIAKAEAQGGVVDDGDDDANDPDEPALSGAAKRKRKRGAAGGADGADGADAAGGADGAAGGAAPKRARTASTMQIDARVVSTTPISELGKLVSGVACWPKAAALMHNAVRADDATAASTEGREPRAHAVQLASATPAQVITWRAAASAGASSSSTRLPAADKLVALAAALAEHLDGGAPAAADAADDADADDVDDDADAADDDADDADDDADDAAAAAAAAADTAAEGEGKPCPKCKAVCPATEEYCPVCVTVRVQRLVDRKRNAAAAFAVVDRGDCESDDSESDGSEDEEDEESASDDDEGDSDAEIEDVCSGDWLGRDE